MTRPDLGSTAPPRTLNRLVLPAPLRPTMPTLSRAITVKLAESTTRRPPTSTEIAWAWSTGPGYGFGGIVNLPCVTRQPGRRLTESGLGPGPTARAVAVAARAARAGLLGLRSSRWPWWAGSSTGRRWWERPSSVPRWSPVDWWTVRSSPHLHRHPHRHRHRRTAWWSSLRR